LVRQVGCAIAGSVDLGLEAGDFLLQGLVIGNLALEEARGDTRCLTLHLAAVYGLRWPRSIVV
jgi:hypothetical protein